MTIGSALDGVVEKTRRAWDHPSWWNLLVVLPWVIGLAFLIFEWRLDGQVAERQQTASGTITAYEPANHNQYGYRFEVEAKSYTGWESPKGSELAIGKHVTVFYDPQNPSRNSLTDFNDLSVSVLGPVSALLVGIGGVAAFIFFRRRRGGR